MASKSQIKTIIKKRVKTTILGERQTIDIYRQVPW